MSTVRRFDLLRSLQFSDAFTLANGACGIAALFQAIRFVEDKDATHLWVACSLIPVALVLDFFDGWLARRRQACSSLGRELDSLADLLSFGAAPATIAYAMGLRTPADQAVLIYFTLCGLARLARYNISAEMLADSRGKVRYYEGTPIPTSVFPLGVTLGAYVGDQLTVFNLGNLSLHWPSLLFALSGSLMISKRLRIPKP